MGYFLASCLHNAFIIVCPYGMDEEPCDVAKLLQQVGCKPCSCIDLSACMCSCLKVKRLRLRARAAKEGPSKEGPCLKSCVLLHLLALKAGYGCNGQPTVCMTFSRNRRKTPPKVSKESIDWSLASTSDVGFLALSGFLITWRVQETFLRYNPLTS